MDTQIIDKIQKLLNLAQGQGTTPGEAAAAAAQAQKLMFKYNISEVQLSEAENRPGEEIKYNRQFWTGGKIISWKVSLISGIAKCNSCRILVGSQRGDAHIAMIGTESNMQICQYLFAYLSGEIERLADRIYVPRYQSKRMFLNSFRHGASQEVVRRLNEAKKEARQEVVNEGLASTALVRLDQHEAAVELFTKQRSGGNNYHSGGARDLSGYQAGKAAGAKIAINRGLDGKPVKQLG